MILIFATHNKHKFEEINEILKNRFELLNLDDIGCVEEIPEEEPTLEGNARQKALYVFHKYKLNCFADDTGLEVFSLNGAPGVHSARYSGQTFASEKERSDANIEKLWQQLRGNPDSSARFRTIISFIEDGKEMQFEGEVRGKIINEKRGTNGFGYDPVFIPDGFSRTFAEMTLQEKSEISHRARAFKKFTDYLLLK